jgi:hypothetical protein
MQAYNESLELRLSLEEVVVLLNLMGHPQLARETLRALTGPITLDEERGRLLSANRTLLAKDIFQLTDDGLQIDQSYTRLLALLADNDFVLRCAARSTEQPERILNFFVQDDFVVEQRIEFGVIHTFREVPGLETAVSTCESFLGLVRPVEFDAVVFYLTDDELEEARKLAADGRMQAETFFQALGLEAATSALLVDDLAQPRTRGSAVRLEVDAVAGVVRDTGFLSLVGESGRIWLFTVEVQEEGNSLLVRPGTPELVRQLTLTAFSPRTATTARVTLP